MKFRLVLSIIVLSIASSSDWAFGQSSWMGVASPPSYTARFIQIPASSRRLAQSVLWLGLPGTPQGTAFVISRKHRLAVTAAHVADYIRKLDGPTCAYLDGTTTAYRVERIWYHPDIRRKLDEGLVARSDDSMDGEIVYPAPDVAIMQLTSDGPDLPAECRFASDDELNDLIGRPIGMLGHPVVDNDQDVEGVLRPHSAWLATGLITKCMDFDDKEGDPHDRQLVQSNAQSSPGFSGSPVFLPNGHVVAISSWGRPVSEDFEVTEGPRVDCIRELISYHKLGDRVQGWLADPALRASFLKGPDERLEKFRRAVILVREAYALFDRGDYRASLSRCDEALNLAPDYCNAHVWRAHSRLKVCGVERDRLTLKERDAMVVQADEELNHCVARSPLSFEICFARLEVRRFLGLLREDRKLLAETAADAGSILNWDDLDSRQRASLFEVRGWCLYASGDLDRAREDLNASVREEPTEISHLLNRADFHEKTGRLDLAAADRDEVDRRKAQALMRALLPDWLKSHHDPE